MIPLVNPNLARQSSSAPEPWLGGAVRWIVVVLALVATLDAAYLTWTSLTHGVVAGCDGMGHGGCDDVLTSRWSRAAGMPVAIGGLVCYGTILVLALMSGTRVFNESRVLATVLATAALLAAVTGLWFTQLQFFVLGAFCYYCLGIHLCGMIVAGLVIWSALRNQPQGVAASRSFATMAAIPGARRPAAGPRPAERPALLAAAPIAGVLLALLVAGQVIFPSATLQITKPDLDATIDMTAASDSPSAESDELSPDAQEHVVNRPTEEEPAESSEAADSEPAKPAPDATADTGDAATDDQAADADDAEADAPKLSRTVKFLKDRFQLDTYKEAVLGSPDAKYVVVELMDYTCPHCRKMHEHLREAMFRYGDDLAIVILPMPLELECNKLVPATDPSHRGACKLARTALAVAEVEPSKFIDFHNFLLADEEEVPTPSKAVVRAFQLADSKELSKRGGSKEIEARIQKNIRLYQALSAQHRGDKSFGLPVQIVGDTVLTGGDITSEEMFEAWEKAIDIKPQ
jgi:uncharacterized membrane protein